MRAVMIGLGVALVAFSAAPAHAQLGKLFKEGAEALGKEFFSGGAKKAAAESAEQVLKKAASSAGRKIGQEVAESAAKQGAKQVGKRAAGVAIRNSDLAANAIATHGAAIASPILKRFGDDGAKAIGKLSSTNARRMAMLTDELSSGGRGADWMRVIAERGDTAAEWIWKNKKTVAIATTATAFLTNPDAFLQAGEGIVTKTVEAAGEHVAEPLIDGASNAISPASGQ